MNDQEDDFRFRIDKRFDDDKSRKKNKDEDSASKPLVKSFQRFDPNDPDHIAWMEANKSSVVGGKKSKKYDTETFNNELEASKKKVIEGQFYEVDQSFAKELQASLAEKSKGTPQKFSFLSLIGREVREEAKPETSEAAIEPEIEHEKETIEPDLKPDLKPKVATIEKPYFFVDITEKQFKDVLNSFSCQQRPELIRKRWEIEREKMLKKYKNIHKSAVRKKEWDARPQNMEKRKRKHGFKNKKDRKKYKKEESVN